MIAAIVPAKALDEAKTRLAAVLSEEERRRLALAMLEDVLAALACVSRLDTVWVVSPDDEVLELARRSGVEAIAEPESVRGLHGALIHAQDVMSPRSPDAVLVVLADVPAVSAGDVDRVLDTLGSDSGAVICPSSAGGTSVLALRPAGAIPFRFGPGSSALHQEEATTRGVPMQVLNIESLARDIDEPGDLLYILRNPRETATRRLLSELRVGERLGART